MRKHFSDWLIGPARDPFHPETGKRLGLVTLFAWAGFGANGLSSACYGPEKAFLALGSHTQLAPALALVTMLTVFLVAAAHAQVIKLFPTGGGGYRVANQLLGPRFGLVSGAALLIDYVLAVVVSVASGTDAIFSALPPTAQIIKLWVELALTAFLILLNLRGMRDSLALLLPIMLGFVLIHGGLIISGILMQGSHLKDSLSGVAQQAYHLPLATSGLFTAAIFLRAFALGGSTYTGVDTVSNNVNMLAEPRVKTGNRTSFYVALSLALIAGGLIFLYSLWQPQATQFQTLNAVVFTDIIRQWHAGPDASHAMLSLTLMFEGGVLLVAANSIFIFAPSLLGHMATDSWLPHRFRNLSNRLVRHNGILFVGVCALIILALTNGDVKALLVLFSINVFLSLTLSKLGLCRHWWQTRHGSKVWPFRFGLSAVGFAVTAAILVITLSEKFLEGGWVTVCLTIFVITICITIKRHYRWVTERRREMDAMFLPVVESMEPEPEITADPTLPTAIFFVTEHLGSAMHELLWARRLFLGRFHNAVFISVMVVDTQALGIPDARRTAQENIDRTVGYLERFCHANGLGSAHFVGYGTDAVDALEQLTVRVVQEFSDSVCFASTLILPHSRRFTEWLHNETTSALQGRLHMQSIPLIILPIALK